MNDYLPADHKGVGLVIRINGRFLWAISSRDHWKRINGRLYVDYSGVGGGVEPGETLEEAARRECLEETGCEVELLSSPKTYVMDDVRGTLEVKREWEGIPPLLVKRRRLRGGKTLFSHAYIGRIEKAPKPSSEVPALLYTNSRVLLRRGTPSVRELLMEGAELVEEVRIPRNAAIRRWGTPDSLRRLAVRGMLDPTSIESTEI